jgi:hypothetical protein
MNASKMHIAIVSLEMHRNANLETRKLVSAEVTALRFSWRRNHTMSGDFCTVFAMTEAELLESYVG